jgi:chemotaxis protein MotB
MRRALAILGVAAAAACGVPEQKYKAALDEQAKSAKEAQDEKGRVAAAEAKIAELQGRLAQQDQAIAAAVADADAQRKAAGRLEKTKTELEMEKAAALGEAERQRALVATLDRTRVALEAEKASATADAAQERERAVKLERSKAVLEAEKAAATTEAERQRALAARLEEEKRSLEQRSADYQSLAASLDKEIKAGRVQVSELAGKLTVRMAEKVLFPSGSATISKEGQATLKTVAAGLQAVSGRIVRVEGHTDNVPIHNDRFPSNWELSSGRAIAVVRFLQAQGIAPERLGAAGYAEFQPIAPNDTPEGKAQNRRIEISLALPPGALPEKAPAPAP